MFPPQPIFRDNSMFKFDILNTMSIGEAHIVVEEMALTEFVGGNSNGKSILAKFIEALTSGNLRQPETRKTFINDMSDQAVVLITHRSKQLGVLMKEETSASILMYVPNIEDPDKKIIRTFTDGDGYKAILSEFGFSIYAGGDICLQLSPTYGAIPFVSTNGSTNWQIWDDITTDKVAQEFLQTFKSITWPMFKQTLDRKKRELAADKAIIENMESYDWREYERIADQLNDIYNCIKDYKYFRFKKIPIPPLDVIVLNQFKFSEIPMPKFYDPIPHIEIDVEKLRDYKKICEGICPMCERPFFEHDCEVH